MSGEQSTRVSHGTSGSADCIDYLIKNVNWIGRPGNPQTARRIDLVACVSLTFLLYLPILMLLTGTFFPALAALDSVLESIVEGMAGVFPEDSGSEPTPSSDSPELESPGAIVLVGIIQLVLGFGALAFLAMFAIALLGLFLHYLSMLVSVPWLTVRTWRAYHG